MQQHSKEVSGVALRDCNEGAASSARLREQVQQSRLSAS